MRFFYWLGHVVSSKVAKIATVSRMILRNQISYYPPIVTRFERSFARMTNTNHAVAFSNGTSALEAAIFAVGVGEGDEVIAPSYTIHSTFSAALTQGARVRFADIDPMSLTIDPEQVDALITERTKTIILVHIWGNPADMDAISAIARHRNIRVIEDCSHCHGATWNGQQLGSFGDIGVFSLQGAKPVAAGEGGIAVTNSAALLDRMLVYGHQGRRVSGTLEDPVESDFFPATGFGRKCRAHPLGIALAAVDLRKLEARNRFLQQNWNFVRDAVTTSSVLDLHQPFPKARMAGFFQGAAVRITHDGIAPEKVLEILRKSGIIANRNTQAPNHHWPHLYDHGFRTAMRKGESVPPGQPPILPHTERALTHVIFLPLEQFVREKRRRALGLAVERMNAEMDSRTTE